MGIRPFHLGAAVGAVSRVGMVQDFSIWTFSANCSCVRPPFRDGVHVGLGRAQDQHGRQVVRHIRGSGGLLWGEGVSAFP